MAWELYIGKLNELCYWLGRFDVFCKKYWSLNKVIIFEQQSIESRPRARRIERTHEAKWKATQTDENQRYFNDSEMPDLKITIKLSATIIIAYAPVKITCYYFERSRRNKQKCMQTDMENINDTLVAGVFNTIHDHIDWTHSRVVDFAFTWSAGVVKCFVFTSYKIIKN